MTGGQRLLLALALLLLTQATFARATDTDGTNNHEEEPEEQSLAGAVASRFGNLMKGLLGTNKEDTNEAIKDLIKGNEEDVATLYKQDVAPLKSLEEVIEDDAAAVYFPSNDDSLDSVRADPVASPQKQRNREYGRLVKSYKVAGNEFSTEDSEHKRVKRSHLGAGIPDDFQFELEALGDFASNDNFMIGSVIPYRLTIHASSIETDVQVEIFSELSGGPFFMISHIEIGSVGINFNNSWSEEMATIQYHSQFDDGRWDYATIDLGSILNQASEVDADDASQIELLFQVLALPHDAYVAGDPYRVSVGAMYQSESYVSVAQDDLLYTAYDDSLVPPDATFSITGPDSLIMGTTGVWTIEAAIYDLYSDIALDVLAPLHNTGVMTIDKISVLTDSVGENFAYSSVVFDDGGNFTRSTYENYGDYGRLTLGTVVNTGYHSGDDDLQNNTIIFEVAITMLDHDYNTTHPYTVGFTLWKKDPDSVEIMWSAQETVQAVDAELEPLSSSPWFNWGPTSDTVVVGGRFAVLLNMSVPSNTSAKYILETSMPVENTDTLMHIERVRLSRIGFNMPHVAIWNENPSDYVPETTNAPSVDFISWDLGIITNTGQRSGDDDNILQFEITIRMMESCESHYSVGESMNMSVGMKHAEDYYWVGLTSTSYVLDAIQYSGDQVPEFTFNNVMGPDAVIYPDSGAVFDLDMNVPAAVDYKDFVMEISTQNFSDVIPSQFRILSMELIHTGSALYLEDVRDVNLTYSTMEEDGLGVVVYTAGVLQIGRVTSMRDENYARYAYEDSTLRIRTIVVARSEPDVPLVDSEVYFTETTVSFADSYIYAARLGVVYEDTVPNYYTTPDADGNYVWQPIMLFELNEGASPEVAKGAPVVFNATFGVPYRTVTDLYTRIQTAAPELQICRLTYLTHAGALVNFLPRAHEGDKINSTTGTNIDTAFSAISTITSYGYGYYVDDVRDSYLSYEAIVMLNANATIGSNYTFTSIMNMAQGTVTTSPNPQIHQLTAGNVPAELTTLPEVVLGKLSNTTDDSINLGGSELFFIDIYVPPGTQHYLIVNVFAPWNETYYGEYEMLELYVVSVGINLACYEHTMTKTTVTTTSDNAGGLNNLGIIDLGYLPSIAPTLGGSNETVDEVNKIRLMAHVAIPHNSTMPAGEIIPMATTIKIDDEHLWVGFVESEVVDATDTRNNVNAGHVNLTIFAHSDNKYTVGEVQNYTGLLTLAPGSAYADFAINLVSQLDSGESRLKFFDVKYVTAGQNMLELDQDFEIIPTENPFGITDQQKIAFKFARNSDITGRSDFVDPEQGMPTGSNDNEYLFTFSIQMLDTVALENDFTFDIDATVTHGSAVLAVADGDTELCIEAYENDNAVLIWDVNIIDQPEVVLQSSILGFNLSIYLADPLVSGRFPSDVIVHYRVPYFSTLMSVDNLNVLTSQFSRSNSVNQYGLEFRWSKIRWEDYNSLEFSLMVDPNSQLKPGLGDRMISIPIDVSWRRQDKQDPTIFDDWYTEMRVLTFNLTIPENLDSLGMSDDTVIKDCQITASSDDGTNVAVNARPNFGGWASGLHRGPPLYQNEYIQVDFSGDVKFTGVTIYPFDDVAVSRITSFDVQYSHRGVRWVNVVDNSRTKRTFTVTWPPTPTTADSVFFPFENSAFIAQHIRIVPQSNHDSGYASKLRFEPHGYAWPTGSVLPSYTCPQSDPTLQDYVERQILSVPNTEMLYACTISEPGKLPYCSGTPDFGETWFALDDNVLNIYGYESNTETLYALARDQIAVLRSKDDGYSWKAIPWDRYNDISVLGTFTQAVTVPFPPVGAPDLPTMFSSYGREVDSAHTWTVSGKALHAYPNPSADLSSLSDGDNQVAFWGNDEWTAS